MSHKSFLLAHANQAFDVAITTFRRPDMVRACVKSCLNQGPRLRRVVVVDDASEDSTEEAIRSLNDERILYYQRPQNGGIAAARRDAFSLSRADWTVCLDSDHELLPGAIERLGSLASFAGQQADILGARYTWDTGRVTPLVIPNGLIGYRERIEYSSRPDSIGADYLCVVSRRLREIVRWEPLRSGFPDTLFQLDLARHGRAIFTTECLALQKSCEEHGWTRGTAKNRWERRSKDAADALRVLDILLGRHEESLRRWGASRLAALYRQGAFFALLAGQRRHAWRYLAQYHSLLGLSWDLLGLSMLNLAPMSVVKLVYLLRG